MLLRIDVYPHNAKIEDMDEHGIPVSPMEPLYACLGTSKADGQLFTVGRKDSDVVLSDKSVSRHHLTVSLVSTQESIEDRETVRPRTPEEEQACEQDPDGMCLVVTDSSRFGTFLVKEGSDPHRKTAAKNNEETDGDETEDESQTPTASSGLKLSPLTAKLTDSKATLEKLEPNSSLVIPKLKDHILIQCGQNGSTLLIRRIPLIFLWSKLDKSTKDLWNKRLPALGANSLSVADDALTHLVTNERTANAKHLVAWYMQKPHVTTEFLQALWDRRSPTDAMPKETDCVPTGGKKDAFWNKKPNPSLWLGCTYICLLHDDMESLCRAAGANVVALYDLPEKEALQKIKDMDMAHCFYISTSSNKVAKLVRQLKNRNVPHVTQKAVATSIVKLQRLKDDQGNDIGPPPGEASEEEEALSPPEHGDDVEGVPTSATLVPPEIGEKEDLSMQPSLPPIPEASRETSEQSIEQMAVEQSLDASAEASTAVATTKKRANESSQKSEEPSKQRRKASKNDEPVDTDSTRKKRANDYSQGSEEPSKQHRKTSKEDEPDDDEEENSRDDKLDKRKTRDDDKPDDWKDGDEPKKLAVSKDGWLFAAPSGKRRKAYRKPIEDYVAEEPLPPEAGTENCSNLVVGPRKINAHEATSMGCRGGKDFKRFRKNRVLKGRMSRIALRSVLPKESEVERELEERQRALEEEQRVADALFRDSTSGVRQKRRR